MDETAKGIMRAIDYMEQTFDLQGTTPMTWGQFREFLRVLIEEAFPG